MDKLKTFEEYTDYRNVTGYGSMGQSGDQNTGPSFNKGPDSATFNRPNVIGVETISMEDPYFTGKQNKRKKIRKNKYVEKLRKDKTKYLQNIDKDSQKKLVNENFKIKQIGEKEYLKDVYEKFDGDIDKICEYLNKKYKDKIFKIEDMYDAGNDIIISNITFKPILYSGKINRYRLNLYYSISYTYKEGCQKREIEHSTYADLKNDFITEMEIIYPKQIFTDEDPFGEEEWENESVKLFENNNRNKELVFLTWHGSGIIDASKNDVYILQKDLGDECLLYNNYHQNAKFDKFARIMTEEEKEKYIYNDKLPIAVYGPNGFNNIYFSQLGNIIKRKLTEDELTKYKEIDPYGEEEWDEN